MINTNLIIGRLGSGKTTCIKHLIENIPGDEYWAIIVNEFGQIGIDSALLTGQQNNSVNITEINGGCICCAAQSQLRVTLTNLIRKNKPDRIIIEATGLGHPAGIIDLLRDEFLRPIIRINSIITVIDISLFNQSFNALDKGSPLATESFNQQTQLADIIILNKMDLAESSSIDHANNYLKTLYPEKRKIIQAEQGKIDLKHLSLDSDIETKTLPVASSSKLYSSQTKMIFCQNISIEFFSSESDEYMSFGFIFPASVFFIRKKLQDLFEEALKNKNLSFIRLKAIFNCGRFWQAFNAVDDNLDTTESYYRRDSRIELISKNKEFDSDTFKDALFSCIKNIS